MKRNIRQIYRRIQTHLLSKWNIPEVHNINIVLEELKKCLSANFNTQHRGKAKDSIVRMRLEIVSNIFYYLCNIF